jgi:uncharacterized phage protein gp47/JayE
MADLPTRQDLFQVGRRAIATTPNIRISAKTVDVPGSDINLITNIAALIGEALIMQLGRGMRDLFQETARADALDRVGYDRTQLTRFSATPAVVPLYLSRPLPGGATPGVYPAGSRITGSSGVEFATDTDAVFGNFTTSVGVNATCLQTGSLGNVGIGGVTIFTDAPFDNTLTVINASVLGIPEVAAGGTEDEDDISYRGRLRAFFPTIRRGVIGAIQYAALQVPGVAVATPFEVIDLNSLPVAVIQLMVADTYGNSNAALVLAVTNELLEYRAGGIPVIVIGGSLEVPSPLIEWHGMSFDSGIDTVRASEQVRSATVACAQFLAPGEILYRSSLIAVARTVPGVIVSDMCLTVPVGDIVPTTNYKILRVQPGDVSFT